MRICACFIKAVNRVSVSVFIFEGPKIGSFALRTVSLICSNDVFACVKNIFTLSLVPGGFLTAVFKIQALTFEKSILFFYIYKRTTERIPSNSSPSLFCGGKEVCFV